MELLYEDKLYYYVAIGPHTVKILKVPAVKDSNDTKVKSDITYEQLKKLIMSRQEVHS